MTASRRRALIAQSNAWRPWKTNAAPTERGLGCVFECQMPRGGTIMHGGGNTLRPRLLNRKISPFRGLAEQRVKMLPLLNLTTQMSLSLSSLCVYREKAGGCEGLCSKTVRGSKEERGGRTHEREGDDFACPRRSMTRQTGSPLPPWLGCVFALWDMHMPCSLCMPTDKLAGWVCAKGRGDRKSLWLPSTASWEA